MTVTKILFPENIAFGSRGSVAYKTEIISYINGTEQRNQLWQQPSIIYDVSFGVKNRQDLEQLLEFFHQVKGRAHSFCFHDYLDDSLNNELIAVGDGITTNFQLNKSGRIITNPINTTLNIPDYILDSDNGQIIYNTPPAIDSEIRANGKFYIEARFDDDVLDIILENDGCFQLGEVKIRSVKEGY